MDLYNGLISRRSVRKFTDQKVERETIKELIKAAQYAPSAHNTKPWEFFVIEEKQDLEKIRVLQRLAAFAGNAQAVIMVCINEQKTFSREKEGWSYADIDGSSATMNLLYAAHAKGLGACWCGCSPMTKPIEDTKAYFNLPEHIRPFSFVVLGHYDQEPGQPQDRFKEEYIHWGKW